MDPLHVVIALLSGMIAVLGFFLKEKNQTNIETQADHENRIQKLELANAAQIESNKHRDDRSARIEDKLDRVLEKLGA